MGKVLPILGIVGAVFAALSIAVFVPDTLAMFLPLLVGLVGSGVLIGQRNLTGTIAGLVILGVTVTAAFGLVGNVSTETGETNFAISVAVGQLLAILACLAIPAAALVARWDDAEPRWLAWAGSVCAAVAFLLMAIDPDGIAQQTRILTLVAAVLALAAMAPMIALLRAPPPAPPMAQPLAVAKAPTPAAPAARPPARRP